MAHKGKIHLGIDHGLKNTRAAVFVGNMVFLITNQPSSKKKSEISAKILERRTDVVDTKMEKDHSKLSQREKDALDKKMDEPVEKPNPKALPTDDTDYSYKYVNYYKKKAVEFSEKLPADLNINEQEWNNLPVEIKQSKRKKLLAWFLTISPSYKHQESAVVKKDKKTSFEEIKTDYYPSLSARKHHDFDIKIIDQEQSTAKVAIDDEIEKLHLQTKKIFKLSNIVGFTSNAHEVGIEAQKMKDLDTKNLIYDARMILGKDYQDNVVKKFTETQPFEIEERHPNGKPVFIIDCNSTRKPYDVIYIITLFLLKIRLITTRYLPENFHTSIFSTCISVPVYFGTKEKEALMEAGQLANLEVTGLVNECSAAVLAYLHQNKVKKGETILVLNMAQNTTCVSVLKVKDKGEIETIAFDREDYVGGDTCNEHLTEHLKLILRNNYKIEVSIDGPGMQSFKEDVEDAKCLLSSKEEIKIALKSKKYKLDVEFKLSRRTLEVDAAAITKAVLVGGATRMPQITTLLQKVIPKVTVLSSIDQDEVIAYGAAVQAAINAKYLVL